MPHRSPARYLAPLAVVAAAGAVYVVVQSGLESGSSSPATTGPAITTTKAAKPKGRSTYTVRPGDTLSAISSRTGVSLERLEQLNPKIDPNSLSTGQKLKLRPSS